MSADENTNVKRSKESSGDIDNDIDVNAFLLLNMNDMNTENNETEATPTSSDTNDIPNFIES